MTLTQKLRDTKTHTIPMEWEEAAFTPGGDWELVFTAKRKATDTDAEAVFQKTTGAGITVTGSTAYVQVLPEDTDGLSPISLICDIQARNPTTNAFRTVWMDRIKIGQDVTHQSAATLPIFTRTPPSNGLVVLNRLTGYYELLFIDETAGDGQPVLKSEYFSNFPPLESPLVYNRLTGLQELLVLDETDGDGVVTLKTEPI
jgi:hypothetical protein